MGDDIRVAIQQMPKVELHAHLNGCIQEKLLFELAQERNVTLTEHHFAARPAQDGNSNIHRDQSMYNVRPRSLKDCFDMFAEIPKCVNDLNALQQITNAALEEFSIHHVSYLELRTTPKRLFVHFSEPNIMASKKDYCLTVLQCMKEFEVKEMQRYHQQRTDDGISDVRLPMICRLIIAADRSNSKEEAYENIHLAKDLMDMNENIVGVDLGGNPTKNDFRTFQECFQVAREYGLKITIHCGEIPCNDESEETSTSTKVAYEEAKSILEFKPDRLGHALLLPSSLQKFVKSYRIPVESCPTSNVMTLELARNFSGNLVDGLHRHPQLRNWITENHPISIGTDDPGIFDTDPTKELILLQEAYQLDIEDISTIVINSIDHAFCDDQTKNLVKERIKGINSM